MKRVVDGSIWDEQWFIELSPAHKCLWRYINDRCDFAGVWKANFMLASFCVGHQFNHTDMAVFKNHTVKISDDLYFIPPFIKEQYGVLSDKSRPHIAVKSRLAELGVNLSSSNGGMVKEKKRPESKPKKEVVQVIDRTYFEDVDLNALFVNFLQERKTWKKPATDRAIELLIKTLNKICGGDVEYAKQVVIKSIKSRWTDFYPIKEYVLSKNEAAINSETLKDFINRANEDKVVQG